MRDWNSFDDASDPRDAKARDAERRRRESIGDDDDDFPIHADIDPTGVLHETALEPCPFCRRMLRHDADVCHHCRNFILHDPPRSVHPLRWMLGGMTFALAMYFLVRVSMLH
ncbi:MAG: hypothetical protein QM770_00370 [Tepidisphaeraceae bacterium]